ncbi:Bark storage protein A [Morella rubra]|uniref:Bark storage protein A n=1 Tax=Morella rubra TaxID=262757 RepID=A0A6A1WFI4_9ROSI|nr:Bark storage protein A [Morella rubra]
MDMGRWWMPLVGPRRRTLSVDLVLNLAMAMGLLVLAQVEQSVQLRSTHPMHGVVDRVNENAGPYIGLVMAYPTEELALQTSGRRFNIGTINGVDVISVMTGEQTLNAGITVQILLDAFEIQGIVHYGTAGTANDSLNLGDVSVPSYVALTGSWKWKKWPYSSIDSYGSIDHFPLVQEFKSAEGHLTELKFGAFNFPETGENLLAKIDFTPQQLYSVGKPMEEVFWLQIEPKLFDMATKLQDLKLQQCINETYCLPEAPQVVYGLRGSTADIYLDNAAYRKFLFKELNVSTVDEESAAIVMTSLSNGVPCIVFRGVSDLAGGEEKLSSTSLSSLAAVNALTVAVAFIELSGEEAAVKDH